MRKLQMPKTADRSTNFHTHDYVRRVFFQTISVF